MAKNKPMSSILTSNLGYDLMIERDAGNPIRILMGGRRPDNIKTWKRLKELCEVTIENLELEEFWQRNPTIKVK